MFSAAGDWEFHEKICKTCRITLAGTTQHCMSDLVLVALMSEPCNYSSALHIVNYQTHKCTHLERHPNFKHIPRVSTDVWLNHPSRRVKLTPQETTHRSRDQIQDSVQTESNISVRNLRNKEHIEWRETSFLGRKS